MADEVYTIPELEEWGSIAESTQGELIGTLPNHEDDDEDDTD